MQSLTLPSLRTLDSKMSSEGITKSPTRQFKRRQDKTYTKLVPRLTHAGSKT